MDWEVEIGLYTLQYTKSTSNDLLYKSNQYSVIAYMGKESEKEWISTYRYIDIDIWLINFVQHLKLTPHYKSPTCQYNSLKKNFPLSSFNSLLLLGEIIQNVN